MEDSVRLRSEPLAGELPSCHESGIFCDVLFHTEEDGRVTVAHAVVLAAAATAGFRSMLQASYAAESAEEVHIFLTGRCKEELDRMLLFIYGKSEVFEEAHLWTDILSKDPSKEHPDKTDDTIKNAEVLAQRAKAAVQEAGGRSRLRSITKDVLNMSRLSLLSGEEEDLNLVKQNQTIPKSKLKKVAVKRKPRLKSASLSKSEETEVLPSESSERWECPKCQDKFEDFEEFTKHFSEIHPSEAADDSKHNCEICLKRFEEGEEFLLHVHSEECHPNAEQEDEGRRFQCRDCPVSFRSLRRLRVHFQMHHQEDPTSKPEEEDSLICCECCPRAFRSPSSYRLHLRRRHGIRPGRFAEGYSKMDPAELLANHQPKTLEPLSDGDGLLCCRVCEEGESSKTFSTRSGLLKHIEGAHLGRQEEVPTKRKRKSPSDPVCDACGKRCSSRAALLQHKRRDCGRDVPCKLCKRKFASQKSLTNHVTIFHNQQVVHEKVVLEDGRVRYKCDLCSGLFSTNQNVHRHKDGVHSAKEGPKRHNCQEPGCGYKTNVLQNFNEHQRVHRPAQHVCERCGSAFISIYNLRKHVTIAHSDGEWLCDSCPKKFTNALSLKRHRATHAEKRLPCHVCGKQFRSSSNLRQHMLAHSDRRPFVCQVCQSGFKTKDKLQRHQRKGQCKVAKAQQQQPQPSVRPPSPIVAQVTPIVLPPQHIHHHQQQQQQQHHLIAAAPIAIPMATVTVPEIDPMALVQMPPQPPTSTT